MTQYLFKLSEMRNFGCSDARVTEQGWLIATATQHRDSVSVDVSNHRVIERKLTEIDPDQETWGVMHCGHWAVGWVDHFVVRPDSPAAAEIVESLAFIEDEYPILSDDDHSEVEMERHDEGICDEHCSLCESDRDDHRRGDCRDDCKLCEEESDDEEDSESDVCPTCGDVHPIANMIETGKSANGQIERSCVNCYRWKCLTCSKEGRGKAPTRCPDCTSEHDADHGPHQIA